MNNLSYNDIEEVFNICSKIKLRKIIDLKEEEIILQFYFNLVKNIKIKPLNRGYDIAYTEEDFEHVTKDVLPYLLSMHRFIEEIIMLNEVCVFSSNFTNVLVSNLIFVSQFLNSDQFWSDEKCSSVSQKIIDSFLTLLKCNGLKEFFVGEVTSHTKKIFPSGVLKLYLEEFSRIFTKTTWKEYPSYKDVYSWLLFNVQSPSLSEYVVYFLPPALFILDDWEQEHKMFGIRSLQHIMENVPGSELRWHGRADVIFEALNHNLYSREPLILKHVYPAAILAASVLEKDPKYATIIKKKFYDGVMDHLLSQMNYEETLALRTIYINALKLLVQNMGIFAVKWSDVILEVCANYLETYEGELAQDRLITLEILQIFIKHCWPRMNSHAEDIVKMVLQLAYEINLKNSEVKNKKMILQESKKVCDVLFVACPEAVRDLCKGLKDLQVDYKEDILYVVADVINKA